MRGKLDTARTELDKAIKLDQKNSQTWALLGDLERAERRLPEADASYANSLKYKSSNMDALLGRAVISIENNKLDEANQYIDTAFKLSRDHPMVSQLRGVVQYRQGKYAAAETSFQKVLKADPNYLPAVSPGACALTASAWTEPLSSAASVAFTIRWRSIRLFPSKAGDTIYTLKCVSPPGRWPAWPSCR